jgi:xanthine dehydrogenase accessory factor
MTVTATVASRQRELEEQRQAFVRATVVRTQRPTSARAGDVAVVDALGAMTGFVGGTCVEASVREFSLRVLETGEPLLLQVRPGDVGRTEEEGAVEVHNPCLSGGSIDVFLEPVLPAAHVVVVGDTPVAQSLARLGADLGFELELVDGESWQPGDADAAVIVASHGRGEEPALERALQAHVPYIGLIASEKRGAAVVASLNVDDALRHHVHTPAGLRLGGTTPAEIALGVLAELVQVRASTATSASGAQHHHEHGEHQEHTEHDAHAGRTHSASSGPVMATDPVCGMTVVAADPTAHTDHDTVTVWFCSDGCKAAFLKDPGRYVTA